MFLFSQENYIFIDASLSISFETTLRLISAIAPSANALIRELNVELYDVNVIK